MRCGAWPAARRGWWWLRLRPRPCGCARASSIAAWRARYVRGGTVDVEELTEHLNVVGYRRIDVVELPGEYAQRGGILDVYGPEMERPVRIELFGDEVESVRRFDVATQRSAGEAEEAWLLPLTETPVTGELLGAIHARLTGQRISWRR